MGIGGQAPSDCPDVAPRLVEFGVDSVSLNPDTVIHTTRVVAEVEQGLTEAEAVGAPEALATAG